MSVEDFGSSLGLTAQAVQPYDPSRICGYMQQALQSLAEMLEHAPDMAIRELEVLPQEEHDMMIQSWNSTERSIPSERCVHQLFEDQVEKTPDAIAIMFNDRSMSYRTLNTKANSLARKLVGLGVKPGDHVAILLERSFELVISELAILKAGAAYVPIDVKAPVERQSYVASDSGAKLLITNEYVNVSIKIQAAIIRLAEYREEDATEQEDTFISALSSSDDTAYVMYTSGSTGLPKGVMVPHRGIVRLIINNGYAEIDPNDRLAFAINPSFDPSTFDVWAPLLHGARMVIIDHETYTDAHRLAEALDHYQITSILLTMALFHQYAFIIGSSLSKLKYIMCGGEQGLIEAFCEVLKHGGPVRLINAYGPTETTMNATTYEVTTAASQLDRLPIGRPMSNTQAYVLDKYRKPVPVGVIGELYIGGLGVAKGYLNRPDLTAERFLPDPFSKDQGARMYKSGDLVRYLPDGNIVFMGRNDDQVKIRGFRIEIGEIEERLAEHALVREVAVLALGESSDKRLVAYVAADANEQLTHILREYLALNLPEYMVPSAFVRLDVLPLTNNGKVNRRALPAPDVSSFITQDYEPPQGELESALVSIWSELLKIDRIGRHDNFFTLGGHSLLAVRMSSTVRSRLGLELKLQTLFSAPTVVELAQRLLEVDNSQEDEYGVLLPLKTTGGRPPLFCIHPGFGLSWLYMGLAKHLHPEQPLYGLQARGLDGKTELAESVEQMTLDYIDHVRQIQPHGPYHLLGYSFGGTVAQSMAVELEKQGEEVPLLVIMDSTADYSVAGDVDIVQQDGAEQVEHLARFGGSDSTEDGWALWERTKPIQANIYYLAKRFVPSIYSGDILFFRATVQPDDKAPTVDLASTWAPYTLGAVEVHNVGCTHMEMDKSENIALIGGVIAARIEEMQQ
ncbi:hypothetical protein BGX28_009696 [Mortierella sp. GBA30]|nr:hypothetical protein BGX28_009696 [Mortierella sp. GBA30]